MSTRYVIVHGHFYQPPREHPVSGAMPWEPGASPFHDFNEKILAECYRPNAELGNLSRMSFNVGPTLAAWMRQRHPEVLSRIARSDQNARTATGHGTAIAQGYHHTILPLDSPRDRQTEIRWGVRSFELLYGRRPIGIWLAETAVDRPTLEACADERLRYTILAPGQVRPASHLSGSYQLDLESGRPFEAIVYDSGLGGCVSFDPIATTHAAEFAAAHVLPAFERRSGDDPLVAIATDGEVYGHHHKFKDLFLQDLLVRRLRERGMTPVSADYYVARYPAATTADLVEPSSWGCAHGLARWSDGCPCTPGSSGWKRPLRDAFDRLAARIDRVFEEQGSEHLRDPWAARDAYVDVVDGAAAFDDWFDDQRTVHGDARIAGRLLEAQRLRLSMYASCAFYWESLDRLEPVYGIRRGLAAAAIVDDLLGTFLGASFQHDLEASLGWPSRDNAEVAAAG